MQIPEDLRYSNEHEWVRVADGVATVGITDFAQDSLGDVVYVALPSIGDAVEVGGSCGEVESTKSVSDIYSPVRGTVVEVNERLADQPDLVNGDPYGEGWIFRIEVTSPSDLDGLLDAGAYQALTEG